jgi:hypothetical protein
MLTGLQKLEIISTLEYSTVVRWDVQAKMLIRVKPARLIK